MTCSVGKVTVLRSSHSLSCAGCDPYEPLNCEHRQGSSLIINTKCPVSVCKEVKTKLVFCCTGGKKDTSFTDHRQAIHSTALSVGCSDHSALSPDSFGYVGNGAVMPVPMGPWIQIIRFDVSNPLVLFPQEKKV